VVHASIDDLELVDDLVLSFIESIANLIMI